MTKYSVEEVLAQRDRLRIGNYSKADLLHIQCMLTDLSERIKVDRGMVPDSMIVLLNHIEGLMDSGILPEDVIPVDMWNAVSMHNITHPTAQAAQVDQVGELLAIIHGDGGHYQAEHGLQKAAKDAQEKVIQMMTKIATAEPTPPVWLDAAGVPYGRVSDEQVLAVLHNAVRIVERRSGLGAVEQALAEEPRAVPDGMVLVPVEPTDAMCDAGDLPATATAYDIYKAMLAAAPSPGESA